MTKGRRRKIAAVLMMAAMLLLVAVPASAKRTVREKKLIARTHFETAERMREALEGKPKSARSKRDFNRVMDAYRKVYYLAPTSSKADKSVMAVAELMAEYGRAFEEEKAFHDAIGQYEFLRREYPGSRQRIEALFTIAQIYREDLGDNSKAQETFEELLKHYPRTELADQARDAMKQMADEEKAERAEKIAGKGKARSAKAAKEPKRKIEQASSSPAKEEKEGSWSEGMGPAQAISATSAMKHSSMPLVTSIRHWSTPDYTRVAIDLQEEVKYEAGRVPSPDRIFFDLHGAKLASELVGKTFEVGDGFLRKIRVAQFNAGLTRVVLEVDNVADYSAFLLPNPYRLIIDIHGKQQPKTLLAKNNVAETAKPSHSEPKTNMKSDDGEESAVEPAVTAQADKLSTKSDRQKTAKASNKIDSSRSAAPTETAKLEARIQEHATTSSEGAVGKPIGGKKQQDRAAPVKTDAASGPGPTVASETKETKVLAKNEAPDATKELTEPATASSQELAGREVKSTSKPTSSPTFETIQPRKKKGKHGQSGQEMAAADIRAAQPTADGERSLIRALGLKIGRIVVDAGHGGHDTGTIGPRGLMEKDLVLDVATRLGKLLESKLGAEVIFTRDDDTFVPLETRTAMANKQQADLFISVHANSSRDASARGVETYYLNFTSSADALEVAARENAVSQKSVFELQDLVKKIALKEKIEESREFATDVQKALQSGLSAKNGSMRDRGVKKAPFVVLIGANMPSILAEISFVSNPGDEKKLRTPEYRQKIAESLYRGVARYASGLSGIKVASKMGEMVGQ